MSSLIPKGKGALTVSSGALNSPVNGSNKGCDDIRIITVQAYRFQKKETTELRDELDEIFAGIKEDPVQVKIEPMLLNKPVELLEDNQALDTLDKEGPKIKNFAE